MGKGKEVVLHILILFLLLFSATVAYGALSDNPYWSGSWWNFTYSNYNYSANPAQNPSVTAAQVWTNVDGAENWLQYFIDNDLIGSDGSGASLPTCTDTQILQYNATAGAWECEAAGSSGSTTVNSVEMLDSRTLVAERLQGQTGVSLTSVDLNSLTGVTVPTGATHAIVYGRCTGFTSANDVFAITAADRSICSQTANGGNKIDSATTIVPLDGTSLDYVFQKDTTDGYTGLFLDGFIVPKSVGGGSGASLPTCTDTQILQYNATAGAWECEAGVSGGSGSSAEPLVMAQMEVSSGYKLDTQSMQLNFSDITFDTHGAANLPSSITESSYFIVPKDGLYEISFSVHFTPVYASGATGRELLFDLIVDYDNDNVLNGAIDDIFRYDITRPTSTASLRGSSGSVVLNLTQGAKVYTGIRHIGGFASSSDNRPVFTGGQFSLIELSTSKSAGGSSSGGSLPICTDTQILQYNATAGAWECEAAVSGGGSGWVSLDETVLTSLNIGWQSLDLSSYIGTKSTLVYLRFDSPNPDATNYQIFSIRTPGVTSGVGFTGTGGTQRGAGVSGGQSDEGRHVSLMGITDENGIIEVNSLQPSNTNVTLRGYVGSSSNSGTNLPTCADTQILQYNATAGAWECEAAVSGGSGSGSFIQALGNKTGTGTLTETITLAKDSVLHLSGHAKITYSGESASAGVRPALSIDGEICSYDHSWYAQATGYTFDASPGCIVELQAGTYELELTPNWVGNSNQLTRLQWVAYNKDPAVGGSSGAVNATLPTCTDTQILRYNSTSSEWACKDLPDTFMGTAEIIDAYTAGSISSITGLDTWPDYIVCEDLPEVEILYIGAVSTNLVQYIDSSGSSQYTVSKTDGSFVSRTSTDVACGASANDLPTICAEGRCGFFAGNNGVQPSVYAGAELYYDSKPTSTASDTTPYTLATVASDATQIYISGSCYSASVGSYGRVFISFKDSTGTQIGSDKKVCVNSANAASSIASSLQLDIPSAATTVEVRRANSGTGQSYFEISFEK